jgi:exodeoxyribonuclease V alpha subunit
MQTTLALLQQTGLISPLDRHFAELMARLDGTGDPDLALAAALGSHFTGAGHICADLSGLAASGEWEAAKIPPLDSWLAKLRKSPIVASGSGERRPLVLEGNRLYLFRYWEYETILAARLTALAAETVPVHEPDLVKEIIGLLFPGPNTGKTDWQKVAVSTAGNKRFCVISGGPGTGKTTTAAKILILLQELYRRQGLPCHMALAAPTGKAADRLYEQVSAKSREILDANPALADAVAKLPEKSHTLHRLLGPRPGSPFFRHDETNPLPYNVVLVDEVSMVDLAMLCKLVRSLGPRSRLILLGDQDQLASVEAGAILGDICGGAQDAATADSPIKNCIIRLQKNYRFTEDSAIARLSRLVNQQQDQEAWEEVHRSGTEVQWKYLPPPAEWKKTLSETLRIGLDDYRKVVTEYLRLPDSAAPADRLDQITKVLMVLNQFRVICAVRNGPAGTTAVNRLVEESVIPQSWKRPGRQWYTGQPVMIIRNDYNLNLFNGDIGVILPWPAEGGPPSLYAFFPTDAGTPRRLSPVLLPEHETVFALTVHKSQGSEFNRVLFLLPPQENRVLCRELMYTALTRARESMEIWGTEKVFRQAVMRKMERNSGLRERLWGVLGSLPATIILQ